MANALQLQVLGDFVPASFGDETFATQSSDTAEHAALPTDLLRLDLLHLDLLHLDLLHLDLLHLVVPRV